MSLTDGFEALEPLLAWQGLELLFCPPAVSPILLSTWCGLTFCQCQCCPSGFAREETAGAAALPGLKGHPSSWESFLTPWHPCLQGLSHCTVIPELFQRCSKYHTSQLPSLPHVHALPCPAVCPSPSNVQEHSTSTGMMPLHPALRSAMSKMGLWETNAKKSPSNVRI